MSEEIKGLSEKREYTDEELDCAIDCLIEAEKIEGNPQLMQLINDRSKKREAEIKSVRELRDKADALNDDKDEKKSSVKSLKDLRKKAEEPMEDEMEESDDKPRLSVTISI